MKFSAALLLLLLAAAVGVLGRPHVRHAVLEGAQAKQNALHAAVKSLPRPIAGPMRAAEGDDEAVVTISDGQVHGIVNTTSRRFLGIPFAAPPTGSLRFAAPAAVAAWNGTVLNATEYRAGCMQHCKLPPHKCPVRVDEDCLYLNVYTPRVAAMQAPVPVIVFIPGGRFTEGGGSAPVYTGDYYANGTSTILVTINYRLGALGWLAVDESVTGNFGLADQRMALQWVQDNIAQFGGDPTQVTIQGQSAGATSVATHLTSPASFGLYHRAILESNPFGLALRTTEQAHDIGANFVGAIGCNGAASVVDCMRGKSVDDVMKAQKTSQIYINTKQLLDAFYPWSPIVDGTTLTGQPLDLLDSGDYNKVPMIIGHTHSEATFFIYLVPVPVLDSETKLLLKALYPGHTDDIEALYPLPPRWTDTRPYLSDLGTDLVILCPSRTAAARVAKHQSDVWYYDYSHLLNDTQAAWGPKFEYCDDKACHGAELSVVFNSYREPIYNAKFTPDEVQLAHRMANAFAALAHHGDPTATSAPVSWPRYNATADTGINWNTPTDSSQTGYHADKCALWEQLGYFGNGTSLV